MVDGRLHGVTLPILGEGGAALLAVRDDGAGEEDLQGAHQDNLSCPSWASCCVDVGVLLSREEVLCMPEDVVALSVLSEAQCDWVNGDLLAPEGDHWHWLGDALDGDGAVLVDDEGAPIGPKVVGIDVLHHVVLFLSFFHRLSFFLLGSCNLICFFVQKISFLLKGIFPP